MTTTLIDKAAVLGQLRFAWRPCRRTNVCNDFGTFACVVVSTSQYQRTVSAITEVLDLPAALTSGSGPKPWSSLAAILQSIVFMRHARPERNDVLLASSPLQLATSLSVLSHGLS